MCASTFTAFIFINVNYAQKLKVNMKRYIYMCLIVHKYSTLAHPKLNHASNKTTTAKQKSNKKQHPPKQQQPPNNKNMKKT